MGRPARARRGPRTPWASARWPASASGDSARLCVALAERAAARAEQDADPGAYLISDNGMMIGPMGASGAPLTYTYREHGGIEALAGRVGLSPATLSRLAAIERSLGGRPGLPQRPGPLAGHHRPERPPADPQAQRRRGWRSTTAAPRCTARAARPGSTAWPSPQPWMPA